MDPPECEVLAGRMAIESAEMEDLASEPGTRDSVGDVSAAACEEEVIEVAISTLGRVRGGPPPRTKAPSPIPFMGGSSPSRRRSSPIRTRLSHSKFRFLFMPHFQKAMKQVMMTATMNGNHAPSLNLFHVAGRQINE